MERRILFAFFKSVSWRIGNNVQRIVMLLVGPQGGHPDNAIVNEKTPAGNRRYRKVQQDALPQDRLDSLVQSLKARGFALPKAKTKE